MDILNRKEIKREARAPLKRHYVLLVVLCAISIFLGTEFTNVVDNAQSWYDILTHQTTALEVAGNSESRGALSKVLDDLVEDNLEAGREKAAQRMRQLEADTDGNPMLGRSRGVLAAVLFAFCVVGWVWEVSLHLISDGTFVNRGTLHGPWLPIYGGGVAMITVLLYRLRRRPALEAIAIVVLCGFVEYFSSYFLELSRGMRWWDYTGYFLNLNGRICGEGLAVFCLGGMAAVYLLVPLIDALVIRVRPKILIPVCVALVAIFAADMVYSHYVPNVGEGITDYTPPAIQAGLTEEAEPLEAIEAVGEALPDGAQAG